MIGKSMVQNQWKILENKHFSWFLVIPKNDEKTMPKGTSKVMFWGSKWRHGPPSFDLSSDFDVLVRCHKIIIFGRLPDGPKNRTNDVFLNTRSQRHEDYYGFMKSRVARRMTTLVGCSTLLVPSCAKRSSKRCLFENHENLTWHPKTNFFEKFGAGIL